MVTTIVCGITLIAATLGAKAAPLIAQVKFPQHLIAGDKATIAVILASPTATFCTFDGIEGGSTNIFTWQTNRSSVGRHTFTITAHRGRDSDQRSVTIDVEAITLPKAASVGKVIYAELAAGANVDFKPRNSALQLFADNEPRPTAIAVGDLRFPLAKAGPVFVAVAVNAAAAANNGSTVAQGEDLIKSAIGGFSSDVTIPVKLSGASLWFLHGVRGSAARLGDDLFEYEVVYANNTTERIPVAEGGRVAGQLNDPNISSGSVAHSALVGGATVNLYLTSWQNPHPDTEITAIRIHAIRPRCIAFLAGIGVGSAPASQPSPGTLGDDTRADVTADFGSILGPVRTGLFSMNTPYLYKQTPQSSERYFGTLGDVSPPVIRIWNWTKPNLNGLTPFDPLHDVPTSTRDNLAAITERTHSALLMNVFSDIPADVLTDQSKYLYYARWYVDQLKYIRNDLRARVEYVELFSESNIGKPFDQRLARYRFFNTVAALIHQEIPSVKVGGMAECWPDPSIIGEFISQCGQNADFITWHLYPTGSVDTPIGDLLLRTNSFALASQRIAAENAARLPNRMLPQAITEYNINYNAWKPVDVRLSQGMGAVWTLSTLTNCLYSGALDWAYFWHFAGGAYGVLGDNIRPNGTLFSVLNHNLAGAKLCAARTSRADVECLAAKTDDGYVLALINKSTEAQTLHVDLLNYRPNVGVASVESWTTTGTDTTMPVTKSAAPAHRDGTFSLPPLSLRLMTIPAVK